MVRTTSATVGGVSKKHLSLVTLMFQNSALILIMHYSRIMPLVNGYRYHASTSVFLNEVIKLGISLTMALYELSQNLPANTTLATLCSTLAHAVLSNESWKLAIPAVLYTIQNTLQYVAVSNLDAATFQVTYQLKILTTAIFSVLMLGRSLSPRQWMSLLLLIVGVSIIQVPQHTGAPATTESKPWPRTLEELRKLGSIAAHKLVRSATYEGITTDHATQAPHMNSRVGLLAVLVACALSGLAGVTFEKILKTSTTAKNTTLWVRNCQLSFWSLFPSLFLGVIWNDGAAISKTGFFAGYNWVVWLAILFQAAGGVIVSLVIKYADNIAKNFATSVSIVVSCVASAFFFGLHITRSFFIGTCVVLFATYLYTKPERNPNQKPTRFADLEKTISSPTHNSMSNAPLMPSGSPSPTSSRKTYWDYNTSVAIMGDEAYYLPDDRNHDHRVASRRGSYFPISQPQFNQSTRPGPTRDRFRHSKYDAPAYDEVEDDGDPYDHDEYMSFDSFVDDRVLRQPFPDRQRRAQRGRARLSLVPGEGVVSRAQGMYQPRRDDDKDYFEQPVRAQFGRFAYQGERAQESSSDVHLVPSSSPALKAGQRRAQDNPFAIVNRGSRSRLFDDQMEYNEQHGSQAVRHSYRLLTPLEAQPEHDLHRSYTFNPTAIDSEIPGPPPKQRNLLHAPPVCQGIPLVPVSALPDRLRTVFPYPTFNAVQSKCFESVFRSDDNFVLASPTGSGKTVILELAVCRAVASNATNQYKVVYQAPTKALCSERQRDWETKFTPLGLKCVELTGDSDSADVGNVQSANIIITTPEKWDSITRKWKDHERLMKLVKVFLIDEVHILKEDRGAVLEAVVSRMKSIGTNVRFVALSATVPNFHDVALWLGKNSSESHKPAANQMFGEEFRPVKLQKHVCGYNSNSNDFAFEKALNAKLPGVISKYSEKKPIMIFCATRASCVSTAKLVANWWTSTAEADRKWNTPTRVISLRNKDLRDIVAAGVTFHHAGLDLEDRIQVEKGFLSHDIHVICCTSTLAVGVNLPCHLVIIKNTVTYTNEGLQEYSDLEMMQMLGRAGRPQFDNTAVAVIMTRQAKVSRYEKMVTGQELLESKLHSNLIEHMNAEIGLGTIRDLASARNWLTGTFFYVRLQQNPNHYRLKGAGQGQDINEKVDDICFRDIALLREHNLVSGEEYFCCTEFGQVMSRYYISFETMKVFMGIQSKATPSEILSAVAQATEFSQLRFRAGEKSFYKMLNKSSSIRFSIPGNLDLPAHKVSLIIQAVLGCADLPSDGEMSKHKAQYSMETLIVFKNINGLIRCIIDCQIYVGDSVSIHSALMLERSIGSRVWDDSPLQMKQIEGIGVVAVRKLINAGFRCMEDLEACEAHRIEVILGRNPPFGMKVLELVRAFPKLRVSLNVQTSSIAKCSDGVKVLIKADIGFINDQPPQRFAGKLVYVCLSIFLGFSDFDLIKGSGQKLGPGQSLVFPAHLTSPDQSINCYVMCDSIGILRGATVKPQIAPSMFPGSNSPEPDVQQQSNTSRRRAEPVKTVRKRSNKSDDFGDDEIDDDELVRASIGDMEFEHIEDFENPADTIMRRHTAKTKSGKTKIQTITAIAEIEDMNLDPVQLANGKWACKHACKDKNACKHLCCKQGMDKPPKKHTTAKNTTSVEKDGHDLPSKKSKEIQSKLQLTPFKRKPSPSIEELDLTEEARQKKKIVSNTKTSPFNYRELDELHKSIQKKDLPASLHSVMHKTPSYCYSQGGDHHLSFLKDTRSECSSDYGDVALDELSTQVDHYQPATQQRNLIQLGDGIENFVDDNTVPIQCCGSDIFGDDDSLLGDAMVGLADSQILKTFNNTHDQDMAHALDRQSDIEYQAPFENEEHFDFTVDEDRDWCELDEPPTIPSATTRHDSNVRRNDFRSAKSLLKPEAPTQIENSVDLDPSDNDIDALMGMFDDPQANESKTVPEAYKDLEPWLFQEFGDIVEIVDV
ncbi:nucleotide-sugar transporter-domain-containing protein [Phaeosphaeriaceae sp. PMI808]|nr:nucleotide-sugar transporter-domain-containing protein [Phaeosphaeriaceae sp. PMI808]